MDEDQRQVEAAIHWFSRIYLGGIPPTITDDSAFLSFICSLAAIEALAGFRFPQDTSPGERFRSFVGEYFAAEYKPLADDLWAFRNSMVHAFNTGRFALTHHHSEAHFRQMAQGTVVLNAEDFYAALLASAQSYFAALRASAELRTLLLQRLKSPKGGAISVGPIEFTY